MGLSEFGPGVPGASPDAAFTPKRRIYVLHFEGDDELEGLIVRARSAPIGMMLELGEMVEEVRELPLGEDAGEAQGEAVGASLAVLRKVIDLYAKVLVSWNYHDDNGQPVPATAEGMATLDPAHLMRIIRAWQQVVAEAPAGLGNASSGGERSAALPLPMEPLSPSLAS